MSHPLATATPRDAGAMDPDRLDALARIVDLGRVAGSGDRKAAEGFGRSVLPQLVAWHLRLSRGRDPTGRGRAPNWRGPTWPVVTWLLTWALRQHGEDALADGWRDECVGMLGDGTFGGYYGPQTGAPAGSHHQSWTAAAAIDWLAER